LIAGLPFVTILPLIILTVNVLIILFFSIKRSKYTKVLTTILIIAIIWRGYFDENKKPKSMNEKCGYRFN